jgi:hypothetical protein
LFIKKLSGQLPRQLFCAGVSIAGIVIATSKASAAAAANNQDNKYNTNAAIVAEPET